MKITWLVLGCIEADLASKYYKVPGMLSTDCKNQSLRDRVDYKCDCRLQSSEFRELDFFVVDWRLRTAAFCISDRGERKRRREESPTPSEEEQDARAAKRHFEQEERRKQRARYDREW